MTGGGGNDVFYFNNVFESGTSAGARDIITDFDPNAADRIDLSTFDAIPGGAHDPLTFIGAAGFTGIGQVRSVIFGATTQIQINASGTTAPDMIIQLTGALVLDVTDFIL